MMRFVYILLAILMLGACDKTINPDDSIKRWTDGINSTAEGGGYSTSVVGRWCQINEAIKINGEQYYLYNSGDNDLPNPIPSNYIEAEYTSINKDHIDQEISRFSHDWFTVTKNTLQEIKIIVEPNYTVKTRTLELIPEGDNFLGVLTIEQSGAGVDKLTFRDTYLDCDQLTVAEAEALHEEIMQDALSGMQFYANDNLRLFRNKDVSDYKEYSYMQDPKEENLTAEQMQSIAWTQKLQIQTWYLLSLDDEFTALFITSNLAETRSRPMKPFYLHLDVTAKYKHKYPKLERAYSIYQHEL